ncbi:MAG: Tyrosine--tRNA ligase [Deltaproteobacteria bacterium ADurb.BinA179]|jgi:tyrosyl-tRNA synthetase|nr:tyrosine--tRNA ligase [Deltaproteobacteria bacterium]MDI9544080.1 tyrosine--tRNA ligase [Pseudomonadota bacterium]OPZ26647.1 MAG: Tyrosine--tRNA ligase [Deltaproteobacteria bacterium ADurb.BinA179]HOD72483.1 tyrosine--tRNA ligase [Deltaproteobacteria bacterium]HPA86086.1 tyrosine--tRNA ligase [Deltaproteobacteria bacterium]
MGIEDQLRELKRGIVEIVSEEELVAKLKKGRPLKVKVGFDPTAPDIHLGHTVVLQKMRQFQDAGHEVICLIGDFTGMIGDPSGRSTTRPPLTRQEVLENAKTYQEQVKKILDPKRTTLAYNSQWMDNMVVSDFIKLTSVQTVARMLERDDFRKRYQQQHPISIHEFLYPFIQGYDSVALQADVELGGTDQIFNLLMGRDVQKAYGQEQQVVMTLPLLEGTDGVQKMSKSYNNYIGVDDPPADMFGKVMSISDELMWKYYELLSSRSLDEIHGLQDRVSQGALHPMEAKMDLAAEMVERFHGKRDADLARESFTRVFKEKALPEDMPEVDIRLDRPWICSVLKEASMVQSTSEAKRLVAQGAVSIDEQKVSDPELVLAPGAYIIKVGKRRFARVTIG